MPPLFPNAFAARQTRPAFFGTSGLSLGSAALASLLAKDAPAAESKVSPTIGKHAALSGTHFPSKVKSVIYLHMVGGPSQLDLFDYKPKLVDQFDKDLPESVINGQRLTTMTSGAEAVPGRAKHVQVQPARGRQGVVQ